MKAQKDKIVSASHASLEAANLKNVWSRESYLTLRTLIYCAELLEQIVKRPTRKQRKPSAWQTFLFGRDEGRGLHAAGLCEMARAAQSSLTPEPPMSTDLDQTVYSSPVRQLEGSLFDTFADGVLRRVDDVIAGRNVAWETKEPHRRLLELLRGHQGRRRSVPLAALCARMYMQPRAVKELVQDLRASFGVLICASRDAEGGGYFLAETEAEAEESIGLLYSQALAMLRVVSQMRHGRQTTAELIHQIELDVTKEVR